MKKIAVTLIAILSVALTIYAQEKVVQIFKDGEIISQYPLDAIDYIEINDIVAAPTDIEASFVNGQITITWSAVEGATYNVYRSGDNNTYQLIAENLIETSYTDTNPLSGSNFYKVTAIINDKESDLSQASDGVALPSSDLSSGLYMGIIGFNQALYTYPISQLTSDTKSGFDSFIDGLTTKNGTLLYYSVDEAITALQSAQLPTDIFNVAIVTFTDGLDQGSMMMNSNYLSDEEYLSAVNNRIMTETVAEQEISAYSVGIRGSDVSDVAKFQANLKMLASSEDNATEVTSMSEVNTKFQEIAAQLTETSYVQTISLVMPGQANGTKVRFTFDNVTNAKNSQLYIEGDFNLVNKTLENVVYYGLTSTSGKIVQGTVIENIFVGFTFEGIRTESKATVTTEYINEWTYIASTSSWQINSEFVKDEQSEIVTEKKSAAIMLVLDCSTSLGEKFADVQTNAKSFIATLCESSTENPETPGDTVYPSDNLSTTATDLSLAVVRDGVRYYVTQSQYEQMDDLTGYEIEGVTVISGSESFIIALNNASSDPMTYTAASQLYSETLPTTEQGIVISARWTDINSALIAFGGDILYSYDGGSYPGYWIINGNNTTTNYYYISGNGGDLDKGSYTNTRCVRLVKSTSSSTSTKWKDERDLKLAVTKDGIRSFLSLNEYNSITLTGYTIEGIAVINGSECFIIAMKDASSDPMTYTAASQLYSETLPSTEQGIVISARWTDINSALITFGGDNLYRYDGGSYPGYWIINGNNSTNYYYYIAGRGGDLNHGSYSYTRCVRQVYTITE